MGSGFGKSATSFLFSEALILLDIVLRMQTSAPRELGRWEDGQDKRGKWSKVGQPPQITAAGGRGSAITVPAESTFKTKGSMNEFAQLDLLMNLYIMDYYHTPCLTTRGKKCQPKENKKGC